MKALVIGNRNYSSWSFRAWLYLRKSGVDFEEIRVCLFADDWRAQIRRYSPAGRVPVLLDGYLKVWDSAAIIAHVRETSPGAVDWPAQPAARAHARSISAEMHSGLLGIRGELPFNIRRRDDAPPPGISQTCAQQVARVLDMWSHCRGKYASAGPWLFGDFSIADVMYAPVVLRFLSYGFTLPQGVQEFVAAVQDDPLVREWCEAAIVEKERIDFIDQRVPTNETPLVLG
jgi:glutathione S-transferase